MPPQPTGQAIPQGFGDEVFSRLERLLSRAPLAATPPAVATGPAASTAAPPLDAMDVRRLRRQEVLHSQTAVNTLPFMPPDPYGWRPPYAWDPDDRTPYSPAFFTHPRFANGPQIPQGIMDPPIAPEFVAAQTGIPLQQPRRAINSNVRDMVDQIHHQGIFRTGDEDNMPYTS